MTGAGYVRVYHTIVDDPRFESVFHDSSRLGTWLQLLLLADAMYPASAHLPSYANAEDVAALAEAGLIELASHARYRVHGLTAEREKRSQAASQSAQLRWSRPAVEGGRPASRRTRFLVLERDGHKCRYCGRTSDAVAIDVDHVVPVREGGTDAMDNLVAACVDCNTGKSGHALRAQEPAYARASGTGMRVDATPNHPEQNLTKPNLPTPASSDPIWKRRVETTQKRIRELRPDGAS